LPTRNYDYMDVDKVPKLGAQGDAGMQLPRYIAERTTAWMQELRVHGWTR
jgi:hypothetical protein